MTGREHHVYLGFHPTSPLGPRAFGASQASSDGIIVEAPMRQKNGCEEKRLTEATVSILEQARIKRVQAEHARRMAGSALTPADVNVELVRKAEKLEEIARDLERRAGLAGGPVDTTVSREAG